jgi:hypothetical protein
MRERFWICEFSFLMFLLLLFAVENGDLILGDASVMAEWAFDLAVSIDV